MRDLPAGLVAFAAAAAVTLGAAQWVSAHGYTLYYGDATAHLNIARRVVDSRTPGYEQLGTVWLPGPHVAMLPFVGDTEAWRSGWAGALPSALAQAAGVAFAFLLGRRWLGGWAGAAAAGALLANPNALYLGSIPMTEPFFLAAFLGQLYFAARFRDSGRLWTVAAAGVLGLSGTLVRYEGWFLLPFVTLYILGGWRWRGAAVYAVVAGLGPLYWLGHNQFYYADPLEFWRGEYSAKAIYQRSLDGGMARYPGDGDWAAAIHYFGAAAEACAGWILIVMAAGGAVVSLARKRWEWLILLAPPMFYVVSMHGSGTPIYLPDLWPNSYYNTRYGLAALPLLAFAAAGLAAAGGRRMRAGAAVAVLALPLAGWMARPSLDNVICWKESEVNSVARRQWTAEAAGVLARQYRGGGIACSFGDAAGVLQLARIPIREVLHQGNHPQWEAMVARPDLFLREEWVISLAGDDLSRVIARAGRTGPRYDLIHRILVKDAPAVEIYRRGSQYGLKPPSEQEIEASEAAYLEGEEI